MQAHRYREWREPLMYVAPECPIKELLLKNSKGQFLTREEKNRVIMYNQEQRKKRSNKN